MWFDSKKRVLKPKSLDRIESTVNTHILPAIGENKVKSFDRDEMEKIIASATELYSNGKPVYECGLIFPIMYYTGMRIGEALGLKATPHKERQ